MGICAAILSLMLHNKQRRTARCIQAREEEQAMPFAVDEDPVPMSTLTPIQSFQAPAPMSTLMPIQSMQAPATGFSVQVPMQVPMIQTMQPPVAGFSMVQNYGGSLPISMPTGGMGL